MGKTRIAIVGSRRRIDRSTVEEVVLSLPPDVIIVSGGARGPDSWAVDAAARVGFEYRVYLPDLSDVRCYGEAASRYYERNQNIVDDCDRVIAFPAKDRKGGTEDTIRRALRAGKPVELR